MRSFIVVSPPFMQQGFLDEFVLRHSIPKVGVFEYLEVLKISEVREIKGRLARHSGPRVFVFRAGVTVEAQNALLKSIEELPSDTFVIFFVQNLAELLLTIQSRSSVVRLGASDTKFETRGLLSGRDEIWSVVLSDDFFESSTLLSFFTSVSEVFRKGEKFSFEMVLLLDVLYEYLPLVRENNLSTKMVSEILYLQRRRFLS